MTGLLQIRSIDPSLGALRLDDLDLIDRLGRAFEKCDRRVLSWAYFAKVLSTTVAKARTRVAVLEASGLLDHQSLRTGNVYFMTGKGQQVLRALRAEPSPSSRCASPESSASIAPAPLRAESESTPLQREPEAARRFVPVPQKELMTWAGPDLGQRLLGLPLPVRELAGDALAEGRDLTLPEVRRAGVSVLAAVELLIALGKKRVPVDAAAAMPSPDGPEPVTGVGAPTPMQAARVAPAVAAPRDSVHDRAAYSSAAVRGSRRSADTRTPPTRVEATASFVEINQSCSAKAEEGAAISLARLALSEAQRRHPELVSTPSFAERLLPELVWASMKGVLADYGEPLRRVRTALRLMSERRWTTPRHMPPAFASSFALSDAEFAVC